MRGEFAYFVEVVRVAAEGECDAFPDAQGHEFGRWLVGVEVDFRGHVVLTEHADQRREQRFRHRATVSPEQAERMGEDANAAGEEPLVDGEELLLDLAGIWGRPPELL